MLEQWEGSIEQRDSDNMVVSNVWLEQADDESVVMHLEDSEWASIVLTPESALELSGKLRAYADKHDPIPNVSHSQTLTTGGDGVTAVPLAPAMYTLDQFHKAIESLRKDVLDERR